MRIPNFNFDLKSKALNNDQITNTDINPSGELLFIWLDNKLLLFRWHKPTDLFVTALYCTPPAQRFASVTKPDRHARISRLSVNDLRQSVG